MKNCVRRATRRQVRQHRGVRRHRRVRQFRTRVRGTTMFPSSATTPEAGRYAANRRTGARAAAAAASTRHVSGAARCLAALSAGFRHVRGAREPSRAPPAAADLVGTGARRWPRSRGRCRRLLELPTGAQPQPRSCSPRALRSRKTLLAGARRCRHGASRSAVVTPPIAEISPIEPRTLLRSGRPPAVPDSAGSATPGSTVAGSSARIQPPPQPRAGSACHGGTDRRGPRDASQPEVVEFAAACRNGFGRAGSRNGHRSPPRRRA